jgi:hypothetical protein
LRKLSGAFQELKKHFTIQTHALFIKQNNGKIIYGTLKQKRKEMVVFKPSGGRMQSDVVGLPWLQCNYNWSLLL